MIDELALIEGELDSLLPHYEADLKFNSSDSEEVPLREQVFKQASLIDSEISDLHGTLVNVQ